MAAGRYSFIIEQGSTLNLELQYKDANGTPIDLTNFSFFTRLEERIKGVRIVTLKKNHRHE